MNNNDNKKMVYITDQTGSQKTVRKTYKSVTNEVFSKSLLNKFLCIVRNARNVMYLNPCEVT